MSFLQTFNNEMAPSLNNFKNYNLTCNEIEKKINRRNIQYEDQITELSQQVGTLNDTLAPLVEEVNFNFINNKTFYIIKDKVETIDNLISNNSNEIVNIKTTLNNIISDSLTLFNVSYKINSKYEDLDALLKSINDTIVLHINEINFNLSDVKINLLDIINKNFQDIETKIENNKNEREFIKFKLIQLNNSYVKDYYDFKLDAFNSISNLAVLINNYFDDALRNNSYNFKQQIANLTEENKLKIELIINNITYFYKLNNNFKQLIEYNLNETNRNIDFGLEKIHLELFNISNDKDNKIKFLGNLLNISNEDSKKSYNILAENFTYLYKLNDVLKTNLSLSLEQIHGYLFNFSNDNNKKIELLAINLTNFYQKNNLKFENLTTLIKIINNSLVEELNINLSDLKQNLLNISIVIQNNKLEMLEKLRQFGTYLSTTLFQWFNEASVALFNELLSNELNSTVFIINQKFNKSDTKLIKVETTMMNINEKLNNVTNLFFKFNNTANDATDSITRESSSTKQSFIQIEKNITEITSIFVKFNKTINSATNDIKREYNARFITEQSFRQIDKNMTNIKNQFDNINDTILLNKNNIHFVEREITTIKSQIKNEVYMRTLIVSNITNINKTCNKFNDTIFINQKNINNANGNISIIKSQISNEVNERLKIVTNITYLQENISIIIKQNNKINESITKTATDIKTEKQLITNMVNNLTTEFKTLERTVQLRESNLTNLHNITIRLNKVEDIINDINKNKNSYDKGLLKTASDFLSAKYDYKFKDIERQLSNISNIFYTISQRLERIDNYLNVNLDPSDK